MSQAPVPMDPGSVGRIAQVISTGLIMGVVTLGGVTLVIQPQPDPRMKFMEYFALGVAALMLLLRAWVPGAIAQSQTNRVYESQTENPRQQLATIYLTRNTIGGAMLEGAAFLNLVTYLVAGQLSNFGMAVFLTLALAVTFPSQTQFETWVEQTRRDRF